MTQEEKAKAYDEALEKAKGIYKDTWNSYILEIFPELAESKDERIRKNLLGYIKGVNEREVCKETLNEWIAWIEKQGEQKPVDKVEPKFKVGDFIVNDYCIGKVIELTDDAYLLDTGQGIPFSCEHNAHLWTIADAKDGDVLCVKYGNDEMPFIFTGKRDNVAYCALNSFGEFVLSIAEWLLKTSVLPATKEQSEVLFQKMHEAGYEWNEEKKELRKKQSFRERYKNIANSDWFKRTHENMSVDIYENTDSNECFDPLIDEEIDLWIKENENIHHNNKDIIELMRDMSYEVSRLTKNLYFERNIKCE